MTKNKGFFKNYFTLKLKNQIKSKLAKHLYSIIVQHGQNMESGEEVEQLQAGLKFLAGQNW